MKNQELIEKAYEIAREQYAALGVNTDMVLENLKSVNLSIHCWQADDVAGFEDTSGSLGGGLAVTGNSTGRVSPGWAEQYHQFPGNPVPTSNVSSAESPNFHRKRKQIMSL